MAIRRRGGNFGLMLLAAELFRHGIDHIPPVTLVTVLINVLGYLGLIPILKSVGKTCVSYTLVWQRRQWSRLLYASFVHLDDMHLYYNMASFLWKGRSLERRFGSRKFAIILAVFCVLTQVVMIALNKLCASFIFFDSRYLSQCAAGFSAVIFGLKVITTHYMSEREVNPMGLPIPVHPKLACWVELVLIQILVPNASFTGHLAGILVGLLYLNTPFSRIVNVVDSWVQGRVNDAARPSRQQYSGRFQTTERRLGSSQEDKDLQEAIRRSLQETHVSDTSTRNPPPPGWNIGNLGTSFGRSREDEHRESISPYPVHDFGPMPSVPSSYGQGPPYPSNFGHSPSASAPPLNDNSSHGNEGTHRGSSNGFFTVD